MWQILKPRLCLAVTLLVALTIPASVLSDSSPQAGLYDMRVNVTGGGLFNRGPKEHSSQECITAEEFSQGPDAFAKQDQQSECKINNYILGDGEISMDVTCVMLEAVEANISGSGSYTQDSFELNNRMTMSTQGLELKMESQLVGKRIGDC